MPLGPDIRLALLLILNIAVLAAAIYAARRLTRDPLQRWIDALLLWYGVQYLAVGVPGLLHCLSAISMSVTALILAAGMIFAARHFPPLEINRADLQFSRPVMVGQWFLIAFLIALMFPQRWLPVVDTDAMTYHVPAAISWLQAGRIKLLPVWFFNPANTFSPLAGSMFIFWLLAPMHSDALLRFAEMPAILLAFLALVRLGKALGISPWAATLLALAPVCSRLAASEIVNPRDDMFLVAFILVALASCGDESLRQRFSPGRIGLAIGLALATKYTAIVSLPLFLLLWRKRRNGAWNARQWGICFTTAVLIAGPWYVRNLLLTGNPLYPLRIGLLGHTLLDGLFIAETSRRLRSFGGIADAMIGGYHGLPIALAILLGIGWVGAIILAARRWREPLVRACLFGALLCVALFIAKSPYGEVRFNYPAIFVAFISVGLIATALRLGAIVQILLAIPLFLVCVYGSSIAHEVVDIGFFASLAVAAIAYVWFWFSDRHPEHRLRGQIYLVTAAVLAMGYGIYVEWIPYVNECGADESPLWHGDGEYPTLAPAWKYLQDNAGADSTIAYTQTYLIYPLFGDELTRRPVYVPVRADAPDFLHLPKFPGPISGEAINDAFTHLLNESPDRDTWLQRLKASGAEYLFVYLDGPDKTPPEFTWARSDPGHFELAFDDKHAVIYRVHL